MISYTGGLQITTGMQPAMQNGKQLDTCGSDEPLLTNSMSVSSQTATSPTYITNPTHTHRVICHNGCCTSPVQRPHLGYPSGLEHDIDCPSSIPDIDPSLLVGFHDVPLQGSQNLSSPIRSPRSSSEAGNSVTSTPIVAPACRRSLSAQFVHSPAGHSLHTVCSETSIICRICHDGESHEDLISPCKCAGTMGTMHRTCIEQWLGSSNTTKCEICDFEYVTKKEPRPFMDWLRTPSRASDKRNLVGDFICFMLLTPLAIVSAWLCITGARNFSQYSDGSGHWETIGLITLSVFLVLIYLVWCVIAFRYHCRVYVEWRSNNQIIKVVDLTSSRIDHSSCHSPTSCTSPASRLSACNPEQVSSLPVMVTSQHNSSTVTMAMPVAQAASLVRNIPSASLSDTFLVFALPSGNVHRQLKETYV